MNSPLEPAREDTVSRNQRATRGRGSRFNNGSRGGPGGNQPNRFPRENRPNRGRGPHFGFGPPPQAIPLPQQFNPYVNDMNLQFHGMALADNVQLMSVAPAPDVPVNLVPADPPSRNLPSRGRGRGRRNQERPRDGEDAPAVNEPGNRQANRRGGRGRGRGRGNDGNVQAGSKDEIENSADCTNEGNELSVGKNKSRRKRNPTFSESQIHDLPPKERIEKLLRADKYECAICLKIIRRNQLAFMCGQCYSMFHISRNQTETGKSGSGCLTEWAFSSFTADQGWQCPHCKLSHYDLPTVYKCFCGKRENPPVLSGNSTNVPHGCGEICGKVRAPGCPHPCTEICHPGPCPGCPAMKIISCGCGSEEKAVRCGTTLSFECGKVCDKKLNCGEHSCQELCHTGDCAECENLIHQECYCGSENRILKCTRDNLQKSPNFSCGNSCPGKFSCGIHECDKKCHKAINDVDHCGNCKFSPERLSNCPCGRSLLSDLLESPRVSCTDPVPTCPNKCLKVLSCSISNDGMIGARSHRCNADCHSGDCPPCKEESEITCRCRALTKEIPCEDISTYNDQNPFLCERRCRKAMSCQKHKCQEKCCTRNGHLCLQVCGKKLECGLHFCDRLCHIGKCYRCLEASFEEQYCMCGRTVRMPPIPCGSALPPCEYPCSRPHPCGHPQSHKCHSDAECPPCTFLTSKYCFGEHEIRNNIPCHQNNVCCGNPCNKHLPCGVHRCKKTCHAGDCVARGDVCRQPCSVPRENQDCTHICGLPCHGTTPCKFSDCVKKIWIQCLCGRLKAESRCFDIEREYKRKKAIQMMDSDGQSSSESKSESLPEDKYQSLQCDSECKRQIRNRKLYEALEIEKRDSTIYAEFLVDQANRDDEFVKHVEKVLIDLVASAQKSKNVDKMSYVFHGLSADRRKFIHEYSTYFHIETKSSGITPHRNTTVTARFTSGFPSVYLSTLRGRKLEKDKSNGIGSSEIENGIRKLETTPVVRRF